MFDGLMSWGLARLPPPPDLLCCALLLSPWVGPPLDALPEPVLLWQSSWEGHFCSSGTPILLSPQHRHSSADWSLSPFSVSRRLACLTQGGSFRISSAVRWCILLVFSSITGGGLPPSALRYGQLSDHDLLLKSRLVRRTCKKTLLTRMGDCWNA